MCRVSSRTYDVISRHSAAGDLTHLFIGAENGPGTFALLRQEYGPCGADIAWRLVDNATVEICGGCENAIFGVKYSAVVDCTREPFVVDAAAPLDACARQTVTVPVHRDDQACTIDLPANTDQTIPFTFELPFGIFGSSTLTLSLEYAPTPSCDDVSNTGWQPLSGSTVRICEGACQRLLEAQLVTVALVCGADGGN